MPANSLELGIASPASRPREAGKDGEYSGKAGTAPKPTPEWPVKKTSPERNLAAGLCSPKSDFSMSPRSTASSPRGFQSPRTLAKRARKHGTEYELHEALCELLRSERAYVEGLRTLIEVFVEPLGRWADEIAASREAYLIDQGGPNPPEAVTRKEIYKVFNNVEALYDFSKNLLKRLRKVKADSGPAAILPEFLKAIGTLKPYSLYISGYAAAREALAYIEGGREANTFLKCCELQKASGGLHLKDFLLMPIQRVPRYLHIVELALKHIKVEEDTYADLQKAVTYLTGLVDKIDMRAYIAESPRKVLALQYQFTKGFIPSSRTYIKDGTLAKIGQGGMKKHQFVLFSDALVYGLEIPIGKWGKKQYRMKRAFDLSTTFIVDGFEGVMESCFMVVNRTKSFVVQAADPVDKSEWVTALRLVMDGLQSRRGSAQEDKDSKKSLWGRAKRLERQGSGSLSPVPERVAHATVWVQALDGKVVRQEFLMPRVNNTKVKLSDVLANPETLDAFRANLRKTHCDENLDFYLQAKSFEELDNVVKAGRRSSRASNSRVITAQRIISDFISDDSIRQVNIGASVRNEIMQRAGEADFDSNLFKVAAAEILDVLEKDCFIRFQSGKDFLQVMNVLGSEVLACGTLTYKELVPLYAEGSPLSSPRGAPAQVWKDIRRASMEPSVVSGKLSPRHISRRSGSLDPSKITPRGCTEPSTPSSVVSFSHKYQNAVTEESVSRALNAKGRTDPSSVAMPTVSPVMSPQSSYARRQSQDPQTHRRPPLGSNGSIRSNNEPVLPLVPSPQDYFEQHGIKVEMITVIIERGRYGLGMNLGNEGGFAQIRGFRSLPDQSANPGSLAGLKVGDILVKCKGSQLSSFEEAVKALKECSGNVELTIAREIGRRRAATTSEAGQLGAR